MADFTKGTPLTFASYAVACTKIVKVNTNTYAVVWIRDSDDYSICKTYSFSNGVWTYKTGVAPIFTGDAWFGNDDFTSLCKVANDRLMFTYRNGSGYLRTRLVNASDSSVTDKGSLDVVGASSQRGSLTYIEDNKVLLAYRLTGDTHLYAVVITVAGDVQTAGTPVKMLAKNISRIHTKRAASNKFVIICDNFTDSKLTIVIGTISGTVITPGSPVNVPGETGGNFLSIASMDDDKFISTYKEDGAPNGKAVAVTVSGAVPTIGTPVEFTNLTPVNIHSTKISTLSFMTVFRENAATGEIIKGSVDWSTRIITFGSSYEWINNAIGGSTDRSVGFCNIDGPIGGVVFQDQGDSDYGKLISLEAELTSPTGMSATEGINPGEIDISFTVNPEADSTNLYWGESSGVTKGTGTKITGVSSPYTHTGRTPYQKYYYVTTSVLGTVESDESLEVNSYPYAPTVTATATGGDSANTISWADVPAATQYDIYWGLTTGVTKLNGTKIENVTSDYEHEELDLVEYFYIVVAHIGAAEYQSDEISATPLFSGKIFTHNEDMRARLLYQYQKD